MRYGLAGHTRFVKMNSKREELNFVSTYSACVWPRRREFAVWMVMLMMQLYPKREAKGGREGGRGHTLKVHTLDLGSMLDAVTTHDNFNCWMYIVVSACLLFHNHGLLRKKNGGSSGSKSAT